MVIFLSKGVKRGNEPDGMRSRGVEGEEAKNTVNRKTLAGRTLPLSLPK